MNSYFVFKQKILKSNKYIFLFEKKENNIREKVFNEADYISICWHYYIQEPEPRKVWYDFQTNDSDH